MSQSADSNDQLNELSFDFADNFPRINQEIFSLLKVKDLLEYSLVSKK